MTSPEPTALQQAVTAAEAHIRLQGIEVGYVFDTQGRQLLHLYGTEDQIDLTGHEDILAGNVFTHNHPQGWSFPRDDPRHAGNSFSLEDVMLASRHRLAEIRAVTPVYRYSMQPGAAGWPSPDVLQQAFAIADASRDRRISEGLLRGTIDVERANAEHLHEVWQEVASVLRVEYSRGRFP